jgi:hypothetical protein
LQEDPFVVQRGDVQTFLPKKGDAACPDDCIKPGAEFGFSPEVCQRSIGLDKYVLADLFRVFPIIGKAVDLEWQGQVTLKGTK